MSRFDLILYETGNGVARVTLNRPEKRNALNPELLGELRSALAHAASGDSVRVVVLSGSGKDFCSGADLSALRAVAEQTILDNLADARGLAGLFLAMRNHPRPIVAKVHGRALAGGCGLATACDLVLAAESAQFGYPEVNIGFVPAMVMAILRRSVPEKRALELIALGENISANQALAAGLINRVFPDATFEAEAEAYIAKLAAKSASAVALSKHLLYQTDSMSFEKALESGVQTNAIARITEDCRRGIERFLK